MSTVPNRIKFRNATYRLVSPARKSREKRAKSRRSGGRLEMEFSKASEAFNFVAADGSVNECDQDPVHVAAVFDVSGYGPHTATLYADQNRFHASPDSALQAAYEIHEEWLRDHYGDHLKELIQERTQEHLKRYRQDHPTSTDQEAHEAIDEAAEQEAGEWFRENIDGTTWVMSASKFVQTVKQFDPKDRSVILDGVSVTYLHECQE